MTRLPSEPTRSFQSYPGLMAIRYRNDNVRICIWQRWTVVNVGFFADSCRIPAQVHACTILHSTPYELLLQESYLGKSWRARNSCVETEHIHIHKSKCSSSSFGVRACRHAEAARYCFIWSFRLILPRQDVSSQISDSSPAHVASQRGNGF